MSLSRGGLTTYLQGWLTTLIRIKFKTVILIYVSTVMKWATAKICICFIHLIILVRKKTVSGICPLQINKRSTAFQRGKSY